MEQILERHTERQMSPGQEVRMSFTKTILTCCCLVAAASLSYAKEWHGIVPLQSARADVERILGPAKEPAREYVSIHQTENEVILVEYSTGSPCSGGVNIWRVPRGTVIDIRIAPKRVLDFANLHLDESKYKITAGGHVPGYTYYTDSKEGVQFEVTQGRVMSITYLPTAKDHNRLRCSVRKAKSLRDTRTSLSHLNLDRRIISIQALYISKAESLRR